MEVQLTRPDTSAAEVSVVCDNQLSHSFDLHILFPSEEVSHPIDNPVAYGSALYAALFPTGSLALETLEGQLERIVLVTTDEELDALPWEYVHGPDGFLVTQYPFVRGLPVERRVVAPVLDQGLHIVAVPSNPISNRLDPLDIEGEWTRLTSITRELHYAITLERTRPPTIERLRDFVAGQQDRVVHFMGHGGQTGKGAILCFEQEDGTLEIVTASELAQRLRGPTFLVTLDACKSAAPGVTHFSNLAASLVRMKIPYALGMRFSIYDDDALTFSKVFYGNLARGTSVEEALLQARLSLAHSPHSWVIGVPVLYTSLNAPASGFTFKAGKPAIIEHQPRTDLFALPPVEGTFQGRIAELTTLGKWLTADSRPRLMTIHGGGGQGKTALARLAAERFAFAWPDGVWAATLENLPTRETFVADLARFLGLEVAGQNALDLQNIERRVLAALSQQHLLILLDNTETLVEAVDVSDAPALQLANFLKRLPGRTVSLLITSRRLLDWPEERSLELGGLSPQEGAALFRQNAPRKAGECDRDPAQVRQLSQKLQGHPLGLRLLGKTFNKTTLSLASIIADYESHLLNAEDKYQDVDHRHRTLYAGLETSLRYLNNDLQTLFRKLWIFHAPFLAVTAVAIFDPDYEERADGYSPVEDQLYALWKRGLLASEMTDKERQVPLFYRLLPTIRPFVEHYLAQPEGREGLLARFGQAYARLVQNLHRELDHGGTASSLVSLLREDLERAGAFVTNMEQGYYLLRWGWIAQRIGERHYGLTLMERALEIAQGNDDELEASAINNIALVYQQIGKPMEAMRLYEVALFLIRAAGDRVHEAAVLGNKAVIYQRIGKPYEALHLYEQALSIEEEVGDLEDKVAMLHNIASVYQDIGRLQEALHLYEQALSSMKKVGNRAGEATTLSNIAWIYHNIGKPYEALHLYEQALPIRREVTDRAGEGDTLNEMAGVYGDIGRPQEALCLYEETLLIRREVGDRQGEARTLNDMALLYHHIGKLQEALRIYGEALLIRREVGDRAGEATTLNNIAGVYQKIGGYQETLSVYEEALSIRREVNDRLGEAMTLNNIANVYHHDGKLQEALDLYGQSLPIVKEVGNRAGEATTISNIASVYQSMRRLQEALPFYEEALTIRKEVGDRSGEAITLNNIALIYAHINVPEKALNLYEQTLSIMKEVGDRMGEAATLNNMAGVYSDIGKLEEALQLYKAALPIMREVGDRAGEAATLNGLAYLYQSLKRYDDARLAFEQSIALEQQVSHPAGEVAGLVGIALLLYRYLNHPNEAIAKMEQAASILRETGLPQDAAGHTPAVIERLLTAMRNGESLERQQSSASTMPAQQIKTIIANTVAVMTTVEERRAEWHAAMEKALQDARQRGDDWQIEVDFYTAVLAILDGQVSSLPDNHPYAQALTAIHEGIATGGIPAAGDAGNADDRGDARDSQALMQAIRDFVNAENWEATQHVVEQQQEVLYRPEVDAIFVQNIEGAKKAGNERATQLLEMHLAILRGCKEQGIAQTFEQLQQAQDEQEDDTDTSFIETLIEQSVAALRGGPQEKMAFMQQLAAISSQIEDEEMKALLTVIQTALFGGELTQLGDNLPDDYRQIWQTIVANV